MTNKELLNKIQLVLMGKDARIKDLLAENKYLREEIQKLKTTTPIKKDS
jgi:hypothetical protein